MHIMVVLRLVADLGGDIEIAHGGKDIDREWVDLKLNEFDDHALEEAIFLKEIVGAKVTAIMIDGDGVERSLQTALARGADEARRIAVDDTDGPISSRAMTPVVAAAAAELGADLVLTGVQSPEDIFGQLAPSLGAVLGWPQASAVSSVKPDDGSTITVQQEYSGGVSAAIRLPLPAVLGVQTASRPIRYVTGSKLRQAMAEEIPRIEATAAVAMPDVEIVELRVPDEAGGAVMLDGDADAIADEILRLLADRALLQVC